MSRRSPSSLSKKRVLISLSAFVLIPVLAHILNIAVRQYDLSLMFTLNIGAAFLIMYNWNLFGIHYNRAKENPADTILYTALAFLIISVWTYVGTNLLRCIIIVPGASVLRSLGYARVGMLIAFSFSEAAVINIAGKCATDRWSIRERELQIILLSGLTFGFLLTFLFIPSLNPLTILTTLLYNVMLCNFLFYFYNQTQTFIPGMLGFALANLAIMIVAIS